MITIYPWYTQRQTGIGTSHPHKKEGRVYRKGKRTLGTYITIYGPNLSNVCLLSKIYWSGNKYT